MHNSPNTASLLGRQALLFPLCLVLFEFATYIANDMIQPGMLAVVANFNASEDWVPTSMTAYLAGGMFLQWLLGPLSDRRGRRPVMLAGVGFFVVSCLAILLAQTIEQFMVIRFFQGISLCFIGAVGYATIQESFEESVCIRITALMANVALAAPLLGPLAGAAMVQFAPWQVMFVIFAALASIAFWGLNKSMPETASRIGEKFSVRSLLDDYKIVLKNRRFLCGSLAIGFASLPLLAWIAQSPVILISGEGLSAFDYGLLQVPVFGALIIGNLTLAKLTGKRSVEQLIKLGAVPMVAGLFIAAIATMLSGHAYLWMTAGLSLYAFGIGVANAGLYRLTLFSSEMSKGTVSAAMGMISMLVFTLGIELAKVAYLSGGSWMFSVFNLVSGLLWLSLVAVFIRHRWPVVGGAVV